MLADFFAFPDLGFDGDFSTFVEFVLDGEAGFFNFFEFGLAGEAGFLTFFELSLAFFLSMSSPFSACKM